MVERAPLVAIGCPVRNRAWVLPEYLAAMEAIKHDPKRYLFLLDGAWEEEYGRDDGTAQILDKWTPPGSDCLDRVDRNGALFVFDEPRSQSAPGHARGEYGRDGYAHMAAVRNRWIDLLPFTGAEYLLSVDSDVIVPPDILQRLLPLADERTIVAAAISNIAGRELDGQIPGNFLTDQDGLLLHPPSYPLTGVLEVAVTGACCLYPRALFEAGVRFGPHHQGEDAALCLAARAAGFRLLVNLDCKAEHRMVESRTQRSVTPR